MEAECSGAAGHHGERDVHPHTSHTHTDQHTLQLMGEQERERTEAQMRRVKAESILTNKVI